jgi:hypothetical protein
VTATCAFLLFCNHVYVGCSIPTIKYSLCVSVVWFNKIIAIQNKKKSLSVRSIPRALVSIILRHPRLTLF